MYFMDNNLYYGETEVPTTIRRGDEVSGNAQGKIGLWGFIQLIERQKLI